MTTKTTYSINCFNPSGGILVGEALIMATLGFADLKVSIPRAGFWWVKLQPLLDHLDVLQSFNPSGGILVGEAALKESVMGGQLQTFQSLGRDSGG